MNVDAAGLGRKTFIRRLAERSHQPRAGYGEKSAEAIVLTVNELQIEIAEASLS